MSDGRTRALSEADWQVLRDLRLEALREAPDSFMASMEEEAGRDEQSWRERLRRARWFVAERDGRQVAVVGLGPHDQGTEAGELFGLWVAPEMRRSRVGWDLVWVAVEQAVADGRERLYFWVASSNGPAVAFASVVGFRPTSERRLVAASDDEPGVEEIAMVMTLTPDPTSVVNPRLP